MDNLEIESYPITPPIGGKYGWGAKAFYWNSTHGRAEKVWVVKECWGETKEKAEERVRKMILDLKAKKSSSK